LIPIIESVEKPMKLSPSIRNIPNGTMHKLNAKNNISARFFLFSILTIFLRNMPIEMNAPTTTPAKWNLYP